MRRKYTKRQPTARSLILEAQKWCNQVSLMGGRQNGETFSARMLCDHLRAAYKKKSA